MRAAAIVERALSYETMGSLDRAYDDFRMARGRDRTNREAADGVEDKIIASGRKPGAGDNL